MSETHYQRFAIFVVKLFCCAMAGVFAQCLPASGQSPLRTWKDASAKFEVTGRLVESNESKITLEVDGKGKIEVPLDKLCENDRKYVLGLKIVEHDQAQFRLAMAHLERFRESPAAVMEILDGIHKNYSDAPYAAAMLGIAYAVDRADYRSAGKYLRLASRSIDSRQAVLGDDYHKLTELAVNNNLAVVSLKLGKGDQAVKFFESNVELTKKKINFCTYHNATLLLEAVSQKALRIGLSSSNRKKLVQVLATSPPANPEYQVPSALLYMLEWSQPLSQSAVERMLMDKAGTKMPNEKRTHVSGAVFQTADELIKRGYRPHVQGTGFLVTPELVVTNRNVVQSANNDLSYTITQYQQDGQPKLVGGAVEKWSPVREEDIAIIRLDQNVVGEPLRIIDDDGDASVGTDITVLGFPDVFSTGEHLLASGGQIEGFDRSKSWFSLTANLLKGNSGGPCVDMFGNVCGVAFEKDRNDISTFADRKGRPYEKQGVAVSASPLVQFIKSVDPDYQQLPPRNEEALSRQKLTEQIRPSVFLIKSWKPPLNRQADAERFGEELRASELRTLESATMKENRLLPDIWCFNCRGEGTVKCSNPNCTRGSIGTRKPVLIGRDAQGKNLYRVEVRSHRCTTCGGDDRLKCPYCVNGKLDLK
jgi:hypothetical protein